MDKVINPAILKNPFNWLIIFSILALAAYSGYVVWTASKTGLFNGSATDDAA